ncbi:hypothetical protein PPBDW_u10002 [Photobacterium kishitanii]|nr:hypothetical protein PPBDW_u10002 [Photobacterium kishitanii]
MFVGDCVSGAKKWRQRRLERFLDRMTFLSLQKSPAWLVHR